MYQFQFLFSFLLGIFFGIALASFLIIFFLMIWLPHPPSTKPYPSPSSGSSSSTTSPSMQLWVGLLPSSYLPYLPTKHSPDMTYSARITITKHKLKVEYSDRNIGEGEKISCPKLQFLAHSDTVDMSRARFIFLPTDISDKEMFSKKFPLLVEGQRQFVMFCRSNREKEDLYRALVDSSIYIEDSKLDLLRSTNCDSCWVRGRETQGERRSRYMTYTEEKREWMERKEVCRCQVEPPFDNYSLVFINSLILHMFYVVMDQQFSKDFLHRKIVNKLLKIKFLKHFPKHCIEDINSGIFPPVVVDVLRPYQEKIGLFLPVKLEYHGVSSVKFLLHKEGTGEEQRSRTIMRRLKNFFLGSICLKLEVLSLNGNLCFNIGQNKTDRIWFGFSSEPQMELQLVLMIGGKRCQNLLVDKLLQLGIRRMKVEFRKSLVLPNMDDIPVSFLKFKL